MIKLRHSAQFIILFSCILVFQAFSHTASSSQLEAKMDSKHQQTARSTDQDEPRLEVVQSIYGKTSDGKTVYQFECINSQGNKMTLISYGATMTSLEMPDRNGKTANIILTCSDMEGWENCTSYFGCSVGRVCNRIKEGKFSIAGQKYNLAVNNGPNHLHGGAQGFDKVVWDGEPVVTPDAVGVKFDYLSKDGEEGYPGNLNVSVTYLLTNTNEVSFEFRATTDKVTPVNLTNHNYWNLAGHDSGNHFAQELKIEADKFLVNDATLIPTGELRDVGGSVNDFQTFRKIGERVETVGEEEAKGYDLCYAIRNADGRMRLAATVKDPASGRIMEIETTQPGLQFYTGNWLDSSAGSGGYPQYSGFCLETQHYPDSPNQEGFPTIMLNPDQEYVQKTVHKFRTE